MKRLPSHRCRYPGGFTLVELIMIMVILGILAVVALPRFADRQAFDTRGFADQTRAAIQFGRKVALASGRNVCVNASGSTLALTMANGRGQGAACPSGVINPATGTAYSITSPVANVSYSNALSPLIFYGDGRPSAAGSLTVHGDSDITINIDGATGYVR